MLGKQSRFDPFRVEYENITCRCLVEGVFFLDQSLLSLTIFKTSRGSELRSMVSKDARCIRPV